MATSWCHSGCRHATLVQTTQRPCQDDELRARRQGIAMDETRWMLADLERELVRFEAAARKAGLAENSVRIYVDRSPVRRRLAGRQLRVSGSERPLTRG